MRTEDLLTVNEVAALARIDAKTIYRLIKQGELPCIRIGRSIRIEASTLRQLPKPEVPR